MPLQNLLLNSQKPNTSPWVLQGANFSIVENNATDPLGSSTAATITYAAGGGGGSVLQAFTTVAGFTYTLSWWAKLGTLSQARYSIRDVTNSTFLSQQVAYTAVTTGWTRFSITFVATSISTSVYPEHINAESAGTMFLWGMQVVRANWSGEYVATTTAQIGAGLALRNLISPTNLVLQSEDLSNASWTKGTGITATANTTDVADPLGTNTASKLVYDGSGSTAGIRLQQQAIFNSAPINQLINMGVWLRVSSGTRVMGVNGNITSSSFFTVTTNWQLFNVPLITNAAGNVFFNIVDGAGLNTTFTVYAWGMQANKGRYLSAYTKTTAAQINASGGSRGLAVNQSLQNLALQSEDFNTTWGASNVTVSTDQIANPLTGAVTADKLTETVANNVHVVSFNSLGFAKVGSTYTASCYVKDGNRQYVVIRPSTNTGYECTFDLTNGTVVHTSAATGTIEPLGNGWYRCSTTFVAADAIAQIGLQVAMLNSSGAYATYVGDTSKFLYVWGYQLVQANWAGNYVATTTTAVGATTPPRNKISPQLQNLLLQSQTFGNASWTKQSVSVGTTVTAPDGTNTGLTITDSVAGAGYYMVSQTPTVNIGSTYTFSVYAKAGTMSWICLTPNGSLAAYFNISAGTLGTVLAGNVATIESAGNGWYRCSISYVLGSSTSLLNIRMATGDGAAAYTGTGTNTIFLWGAQTVQANWPGDYQLTTTVAIGSTTPPRNRVIQAQNLALRSEDFSNAYYTKTLCSITTDQIANPINGAITADALVDTVDVNGQHYIQMSSLGITLGNVYTLSVFAKAAAKSVIFLEGSTGACYYDLTNGVTGQPAAGALAYGITSYGNGWYRCYVTFLCTAVTTNFIQVAGSVGTLPYTGAANTAVYLWGTQVTQGYNSSSTYVQTTTAVVNTGSIRKSS